MNARNLTVGSLCSGYGGLDLAVEGVFGASTRWFCEFESAPSKVLAHHWPGVPNHGDMTAVDWSTVEPVDIIAGGTPCQDLSGAGKRAGMTDGTRSNLWVQMRECVAAVRPRFVVWENVRGALSAYATSEVEHEPGLLGEPYGPDRPALRALGRVVGDLSDLGYDCRWTGVRAADVGAPHGRYRVFVLAHAAQHGLCREAISAGGSPACADREGIAARSDRARAPADAKDDGRARRWPAWRGRLGSADGREAAADTRGCGCDGGPRASWRQEVGGAPVEGRRQTAPDAGRARVEQRRDAGDLVGAPSTGEGTPRERERERHGHVAGDRGATDWGAYEPAIRHWERILGRVAPAPTEPGRARNGSRRLSARFEEWMMGLPDGWVTAPGLGLSWKAQVKMLGNGVVPQQAAHALRSLRATRGVAP